MSVYQGQTIALTTLHGKELGASLTVCACDTNALGTFSGEVERLGSALGATPDSRLEVLFASCNRR